MVFAKDFARLDESRFSVGAGRIEVAGLAPGLVPVVSLPDSEGREFDVVALTVAGASDVDGFMADVVGAVIGRGGGGRAV